MPKLGSTVTTGAREREAAGLDWRSGHHDCCEFGLLLIMIDGQKCCHNVGLLLYGLDCKFTLELELEMHGCRGAAVVKGRAAGCPNQLDPPSSNVISRGGAVL
ncbi:hypothetical protein M0R45_026062 [Rubus argutus]|uniref:Uncharacterized protein n=1 Tax=Rubus argutus TaxID=59490 RepID=A0AAW1WYZ2_RUBAR